MPTGYTYDVEEGKITTLEEFASSCARAFLIQARDSNEKDLRKLVAADESGIAYYEKRIVEADKVLLELESYSEEDWKKAYDAEIAAKRRRQDDWDAEKLRKKIRYENMLLKVMDWEPPTDKHVEMKSFMIKQLQDSISFDCKVWPRSPDPDYKDWKKYKYERALNDIEYAIKELNGVKARKNDYVQWVEDLLESVKGK